MLRRIAIRYTTALLSSSFADILTGDHVSRVVVLCLLRFVFLCCRRRSLDQPARQSIQVIWSNSFLARPRLGTMSP